jgi:acetyl-CoA acetyltransferase
MNLNKIRKGVAVVGAGMTIFARRLQETGKEMSWEAAKMALMKLDSPSKILTR